MTISLPTTTITVQRQNQDGDPDAEPTWDTVFTGVNAHFTLRQTGSEISSSEGRSMANSILMCDTIDLQAGDRVITAEGEVWETEWVIQRTFPGGFDYTRAEVIKRTAEMGAML